jgi:hypothetical protein
LGFIASQDDLQAMILKLKVICRSGLDDQFLATCSGFFHNHSANELVSFIMGEVEELKCAATRLGRMAQGFFLIYCSRVAQTNPIFQIDLKDFKLSFLHENIFTNKYLL